MMRVQRQHAAEEISGAAVVSELLEQHPQTENRVEIVRVQRKRCLQIIQRGAVKLGAVIGGGAGMEALGKSRRMVGQ